MKYYSEKLNTLYDTEEMCKTAEEDFEKAEIVRKAKLEAIKKEEEAKKLAKENRKKELIAQIEKAEEDITNACKEFVDTKETAIQMVSEAYDMAEAMLEPYQEKIDEAKKARKEAVEAYNKEYGYTYSKEYMFSWLADILK